MVNPPPCPEQPGSSPGTLTECSLLPASRAAAAAGAPARAARARRATATAAAADGVCARSVPASRAWPEGTAGEQACHTSHSRAELGCCGRRGAPIPGGRPAGGAAQRGARPSRTDRGARCCCLLCGPRRSLCDPPTVRECSRPWSTPRFLKRAVQRAGAAKYDSLNVLLHPLMQGISHSSFAVRAAPVTW